MALYLKTAGGVWSAAATWSATSAAGVDNAGPPTAATDVILELASGALTIDAGAVCRSLDTTSGVGTYGGTATHTTGVTLTIGDGTSGAGNVGLKLNSGMTYTLGNSTSSALVFASTNGTAQTITTAGKVIGNFTLSGSGGSWQLADNFTSATSASIAHTRGTFDTNGKTVITDNYNANNTNTKTMTWGASSITGTGISEPVFNFAATGTTITANTAILTMNGVGAQFSAGTGMNFNGASLVLTGGGSMTVPGVTFASFTCTGNATKTCQMNIVSTPLTITGTLTLTGNSAINRLIVASFSAPGTARTISAAAISLTNVDFQDITGAGLAANAAWTGTSLGDCQGNSNITFTTPATQTWSGTSGGNWSTNAWTSRVPLPQDNVVISSAFSASQTVTFDMPRLGKNIDWTGTTGSPAVVTGTSTTLFGSLTLVAGVGTLSGGGSITFAGRSSLTITSAGHIFTSSPIVQAPTGTYTLQDAFSTTSLLSITIGTLTSNNFNVTALSFSVAGTGATYNAGTSTMTLTGTNGGIFTRTNSAAYNGGSDTVIVANASTTTRTFSVSAVSIGTLNYTVANSPGSLTLAGAGTFGTINVGSGRILTMPASTTVAVTNFNVNGTNNGYLYLPGVIGNYVTYNTSVLGSLSTIEYAVRVALDSYAGTLYLAGWDSTHSAIHITATRKLNTYVLNTGVVGIGNVASTSAFPDPGSGYIWLRSKLTISSALCEYWYSNDNTDTFASVTWTSLGTPTGANAGTTPLLTQSGNPVYGAISSGIAGAPGKYRQRVEIIDGVTRSAYDATAKAFGVNSSQDPQGNTWSVLGTLAQAGDGRVSLVSSTPTTQATVSKSSGVVSVDYLTIQDSAATGGASWYAGAHSILVSNDTGWNFRAPPSGTPNLMMMGLG